MSALTVGADGAREAVSDGHAEARWAVPYGLRLRAGRDCLASALGMLVQFSSPASNAGDAGVQVAQQREDLEVVRA